VLRQETEPKCVYTCAQKPSHYITSWNRVPLEKLIVDQVVKKFLAVYGTRRFLTMFIRYHYWPVS